MARSHGMSANLDVSPFTGFLRLCPRLENACGGQPLIHSHFVNEFFHQLVAFLMDLLLWNSSADQ